MKFKKYLLLFMVLALVVLPTAALAHGLNFTLEEPGVLKPEYDGGGFSPRMEVTLYDENDQVIESGQVDEDGLYRFDPDTKFAYAEVNDGMGHQATYEPGEEPAPEIPKVPVVIAVFVIIILIFYFNNKKKKNKED